MPIHLNQNFTQINSLGINSLRNYFNFINNFKFIVIGFTLLVVLLGLSTISTPVIAKQASEVETNNTTASPTWPSSWNAPAGCLNETAGEPSIGIKDIDLVGDTTNPPAGFQVDTQFQYFSVRLVGDPSKPNGGFVQQAWVVLFQISGNQYQYLASLNGKEDKVQLWRNTTEQGPVDFDPLLNDPAENLIWEGEASVYARIRKDASIYYVDWAIPMAQFAGTGITDSTTKYFATSANANNFNKDYLDCYETPEVVVVNPVITIPIIIPNTNTQVQTPNPIINPITNPTTGGTTILISQIGQNSTPASLIQASTVIQTLTQSSLDISLATQSSRQARTPQVLGANERAEVINTMADSSVSLIRTGGQIQNFGFVTVMMAFMAFSGMLFLSLRD